MSDYAYQAECEIWDAIADQDRARAQAEADREKLIDRRVQRRLSTDRDYLFAESAEVQSLAERKIELQEERAVLAAAPHPDAARIEEIDTELEQVFDDLRSA